MQADLLDRRQTELAISGSDFVYLCVGLPYEHKVWADQWERIMANVIDACVDNDAKLIFLDNVYMYTSDLPNPFDERTAQQPSSKKGVVRKKVADLFMQAIESRGLRGLIARSADFYGVGASNSVFYLSFLERVLKGKAPQLLSAGNVKHTFANVDDNARAMVDLALCEDCYGQVWHLPVGTPITMDEALGIVNELRGTSFENSVMPGLLKRILPLFIPILKEAKEMEYQFENEYVMSYAKFSARFPDFEVTAYKEGISEMIASFEGATRKSAPTLATTS